MKRVFFLKRWALAVTPPAVHRLRRDLRDVYDSFAPLALRRLITVRRDGLVLKLSRAPAHRQMAKGEFEPDELVIVRDQLTESDVFVDVGANVGLYACMARLAGRHTIAVEPQLKNLALLYWNLAANGSGPLEVYPVGLSDQPGLVELHGVSGTGASLIKGWAEREQTQRIHSTIPVTTLDILLGSRFRGQRIFIKVDVEGAEYAVLQGGRETLVRTPRPAWLVEICLEKYHPGGWNAAYAQTFEPFWKAGYQARTADAARRVVTPADLSRWQAAGRCELGVINFLFTAAEQDA